MLKRLTITIDGPAGAGKSTLAKALAERLGYLYLNTGAMYRAFAWKTLNDNVNPADSARVARLARDVTMELTGAPNDLHVVIDGIDVSSQIARPEVTRAASVISAYPEVRRALVSLQQKIAIDGGVVAEGRDTGTVVFPNADVKIYLDASASARGERRHKEDVARGVEGSLEATRNEILERDRRDSTRLASPLIKANDAVYLDTSKLTIEEMIDRAVALISEAHNVHRDN